MSKCPWAEPHSVSDLFSGVCLLDKKCTQYVEKKQSVLPIVLSYLNGVIMLKKCDIRVIHLIRFKCNIRPLLEVLSFEPDKV